MAALAADEEKVRTCVRASWCHSTFWIDWCDVMWCDACDNRNRSICKWSIEPLIAKNVTLRSKGHFPIHQLVNTVCLHVYLSVSLPVCQLACLSVCLSVCSSVCRSVSQSVCLCICLCYICALSVLLTMFPPHAISPSLTPSLTASLPLTLSLPSLSFSFPYPPTYWFTSPDPLYSKYCTLLPFNRAV